MDERELSAEDEAVVRELIDGLLREPEGAALLEQDDFLDRFQKGLGKRCASLAMDFLRLC